MSPQNSSVAALTISVAITGASLIAVASVSPPAPNVQARAVRLADVDTADSPLGDGTALVFGPSGVPIPPPQYVDAADTLYLQPLGFPIFVHTRSLTGDRKRGGLDDYSDGMPHVWHRATRGCAIL
jgi:hypothetical protein